MLHLGVTLACHGFNQDGVAVDFHHDHDVPFATARRDKEPPRLVGVERLPGLVHFDVHVTFLFSRKVCRVNSF